MSSLSRLILLIVVAVCCSCCCCCCWCSPDTASSDFARPPRLDATPSEHEDNWAVLVSTSKYWHNFRQSSNVFLMYQLLRANGFSDDRILLFAPENHACDRRNPDRGFAPCSSETNYPNKTLFGANVDIDFHGVNADAHTFLRVLYGSQAPGHRTPLSKQLRSTKKSNVLIFIASHSGEYFTKFQDYEFLSAFELAHAFQELHRLEKYHRLLFVVDTCKGFTLFDILDAPNVVSLASSGPKDDGRSHDAHFNNRAVVHALDGMSSEMHDFLANEQQQQQQRKMRKRKKDKEEQKASRKASTPPTTLRNMFRWLKANPFIVSNMSVSHPEDYYRREGLPDVLDNGSWLVSDFFVQKKTKKRVGEDPTMVMMINNKKQHFFDDLDGDFAFWNGI